MPPLHFSSLTIEDSGPSTFLNVEHANGPTPQEKEVKTQESYSEFLSSVTMGEDESPVHEQAMTNVSPEKGNQASDGIDKMLQVKASQDQFPRDKYPETRFWDDQTWNKYLVTIKGYVSRGNTH